MSDFKTIDEAIAAVDGTVTLTITKWDDGFTWEITVTTNKKRPNGTYQQFEYDSTDWDGEVYETATEAGIAACKTAIAIMSEEKPS